MNANTQKLGNAFPDKFEVTHGRLKGQTVTLHSYGDAGENGYNKYLVNGRLARIEDKHVKPYVKEALLTL